MAVSESKGGNENISFVKNIFSFILPIVSNTVMPWEETQKQCIFLDFSSLSFSYIAVLVACGVDIHIFV